MAHMIYLSVLWSRDVISCVWMRGCLNYGVIINAVVMRPNLLELKQYRPDIGRPQMGPM